MKDERTTDDARPTDAAMSYADRVLYEAQVSATRGLDLARAAGVVTDLVAGIERMAAALRGANYATRTVACHSCKAKNTVPGADPDVVARAAAHTMKTTDSLVRLQEFAAGRPDSRPDTGTAWLQALTNEQLAIVSGWIEANGQRAAGRD